MAEILLDEKQSFEHARRVLMEVGIADPVKADKNIQLLAGRGAGYEMFCRILPDALRALHEVANPDMALNNWERLAGVMRDREHHFGFFNQHPSALQVLLNIIGTSQYLADILIRRPQRLVQTVTNHEWEKTVETEALSAEVSDLVGRAEDYNSKLDMLRDFKQRHMLRVGTMDICGKIDVEPILKEMSSLADVCIQAAFDIAEAEVCGRFGRPLGSREDRSEEATAVVIALGKLGGAELNYSSDIDLMFIYSHDGETSEGVAAESIVNNEYFSKLAEKCIDLLARVTDQGHLFRVDMRLRPMGSKGPLVSSLESHLDYYEIFGESWERQALLKARPVAGDMELGRQFLKEIRPFVYPKYLDHRNISEIQGLKRRIERDVDRQGRTRTEVKLGRGGIRDIEFTVQFHQLLNGGKHPELRGTNTLVALRTLEQTGYLSAKECGALVEAYKFLRTVENRLQIMQNLQLHALPSNPADIEALARSLDYQRSVGRSAAKAFEKEYKRHTDNVRELFDKFFGKMFAGAEKATPIVDLIMNPDPTEEEIEDTLGRFGFRNHATAYENLRSLAEGGSLKQYSSRARNFFCSIAPLLIRNLEKSPDPDMALINLQRCIAALGAPSTFYEILSSNPKSIEVLVALSSYSDHLIRLFVNDPGVFDFLMGTGMLEEESSQANIDKALGKFLKINPDFFESVQRFKNGELLRIGLRDILGLAQIEEVTRELSSVAEVMLDTVYQRYLDEHVERYGKPVGSDGSLVTMAILGMGKFGGREINYASDLDVIFVYSSEGQTEGGVSDSILCQQFFAGLAAQVMKKLSLLNPYGYLYKMDARLRPDGEQGLLAVSVDSFQEYHCRKSALWEKLAMTRLRPVAGDMALGKSIEEFVHSVIYAKDFFSKDVVDEAIEMLHKIFGAARAEENEGVKIKNAEGGIIEIEFLVQLLQLKYGADVAELRTAKTLETLDRLADGGHISRLARDDLRAALVFLRRVENRMRLMHNRSLNELPTDTDALDKLALRLGITVAAGQSPGEKLIGTLEANIQRSHRVFEEEIEKFKKADCPGGSN